MMKFIHQQFSRKSGASLDSLTANSSSADSDNSCIMLSKKPPDSQLYRSIFRSQTDSHSSTAATVTTKKRNYERKIAGLQASPKHAYVNHTRQAHDLPWLNRSRELDRLARDHAKQLANRRSLYHSCASVSALQHRLQSRHVGENVQRGPSIHDMYTCMLQCQPQMQNILYSRVTHFGIGTAKGQDGIYMVQLFRAE